MLNCHDLPTAEVYTATIQQISGNTYGSAVNLSKVVMYDRNMNIDGVPSITRYIQISSSILATIPKHNSLITINSTKYKMINPRRCANPAFVTFWESEIQKVD